MTLIVTTVKFGGEIVQEDKCTIPDPEMALSEEQRTPPPVPLFRDLQPRCGARCRDGHPCCRRALVGRTRCRTHGGLSTGPKTPEGRARIAESNQRRARSSNAHI